MTTRRLFLAHIGRFCAAAGMAIGGGSALVAGARPVVEDTVPADEVAVANTYTLASNEMEMLVNDGGVWRWAVIQYLDEAPDTSWVQEGYRAASFGPTLVHVLPATIQYVQRFTPGMAIPTVIGLPE